MIKRFSKLKFAHQKVLEHYTLDNWSYKEIAQKLEIPYDTVFGIVQRLRPYYTKEIIETHL